MSERCSICYAKDGRCTCEPDSEACSHGHARQLNALTQWCPDCGALADKHAPMQWRWELPTGAR